MATNPCTTYRSRGDDPALMIRVSLGPTHHAPILLAARQFNLIRC
ncbi:MAG: hypothetical protein QNJ16_07445 [Rhodobacter sp.]|nr:hypothetical protein [Rhodobacter sp.]